MRGGAELAIHFGGASLVWGMHKYTPGDRQLISAGGIDRLCIIGTFASCLGWLHVKSRFSLLRAVRALDERRHPVVE
jgi:hypothetical protein